MKNFGTLSWSKIEAAWHTRRGQRHAAELERALLLRQLRDTAPWLDRKRYASRAAYDEMTHYTFDDVLRDRLHEGTAEVRNTLRVLDTFGEAAFKRYGRIALVRIYNRIKDVRDRKRVFDELDKFIKKQKTRIVPGSTTTSWVIDRIVPRKKRTNTIEMVRKLQEKVAELRKRVKQLEKENVQLKRDLVVALTPTRKSRVKKTTTLKSV